MRCAVEFRGRVWKWVRGGRGSFDFERLVLVLVFDFAFAFVFVLYGLDVDVGVLVEEEDVDFGVIRVGRDVRINRRNSSRR